MSSDASKKLESAAAGGRYFDLTWKRNSSTVR
jgi:hypothetical protein